MVEWSDGQLVNIFFFGPQRATYAVYMVLLFLVAIKPLPFQKAIIRGEKTNIMLLILQHF